MQLSRLPVGHGVAESTVDSGRIDKHPLKRARTTLSYLAIAMLGTEEERLAMRRDVNRSHVPVHSSESDPVQYNAFDPDLQLWVAACLYRGVELSYEILHGKPDDETADVLYRHSARLGTTLQVTEDMWPPTRAAFEDYWNASLSKVAMDDVTRDYLLGIAGLKFLPAPVSWILGPLHRFATAGFLPGLFRDELGLPWGPTRQRAFDLATSVGGRLTRLLPAAAREFPLNAYLWDTRRRIRSGRPIV